MAIAIQTSKQPWLRRPSGLVRPDWNSWQANSLAAWFANWAGAATYDSGFIVDLIGSYKLPASNISLEGTEMGFVPKFNGTTSYYLSASALFTAPPFTLVAWFSVANITASHALLSLGSGTVHNFTLFAAGSRAGDPVSAGARDGSVNTAADGPAYVANRWTHGAAVYASSTSRVAYTNGISGTVDTTSVTPTVTRFSVGVNSKTAIADFTNGHIADARFYSRVLDAAEIEALYHPRTRWELYQPSSRRTYFFYSQPSTQTVAIQTSKQPWLRRPSGVVCPDWTRPISQSLRVFLSSWESGGVVNSVMNTVLTGTATTKTPADLLGGMAGRFVAASSSNYELLMAPVIAVPITISAWFLTASNNQVLAAIGDGTATRVQLQTRASTGYLAATVVDTGGNISIAEGSVNVADNKWHHGVAVFTSSTLRTIYLDGGTGATNTDSRALGTPNRITIGARVASGSKGAFFGGDLADVCVWNRALDAAEIEALYHPRTRWELYQG